MGRSVFKVLMLMVIAGARLAAREAAADPVPGSADKWRHYQSPNFELYSAANDQESRATLWNLELIRGVFFERFKVPYMSDAPKRIRILVIDDDRGSRLIARNILTQDPNCEIVGEAENGEDGLRMSRKLKPSVIVTDLDMPVLGGIEMMTLIAMHDASIAMVMFSATEDDAVVQHGFALGAFGFVPKRSPADLLVAVRRAAEGGFYFSS
jgi:CheY-like chemotaxis protein